MQEENTKIIEGILQLHINNKHESYLCLLNRFNKLDFPIAIINDQLDILFTNATINQLFKDHEITKYDNLHQIHDCIHLLEYLRQHQKDDYPFFFSTLDGKAIGSFILSPEHFFINNEAYHLIYTEHIKGNQRSPSIKYQSLIEQLGIGLGYYDLNGKIISFNKIAANYLGGIPEDFQGKEVYEIFPKAQADVYRNRMNKCLQSDDSISFIDEILLPNGIKWFKSIYSKVFSENGNLTGIQIVSDDVSSLKHAEKNLINEEDKFRTFINNAADGVAIVDENAKVSFVNKEFCKLLSIEEKDLLGVNAWDLIYSMSARPDKDESYRDQIKSQLLQLLKSKEATNVVQNKTTILQRNKQNSIDITESVFVFPTSKGNNIGVFLRDITELKKAEKEIQSAYELLSETEKIAKSGSWTSNPKTGEGSWSKGSYAIRGASSDMVGTTQKHYEFMHPDDKEHYQKEFDLNIKSGNTEFKQQYRLIDSLGKIKHIEAHYEIQRDEKGNAVFITGIDKDITEVIEKQQKLEKSEKRFRDLFENSADAVALASDSRIINCNKAFLKLFEYPSKEEIIGTHPSKLSPDYQGNGESSKEGVERNNKDLYLKGFNKFEWIHRKKDGQNFPAEILLTYLGKNPDGEDVLHAVIRDITDRKNRENEILQAKETAEKIQQKLEEAQKIAKLGSWELDVRKGILTLTNSFYSLFHTSAEEMGGFQIPVERYAELFVHPDDAHLIEKETKLAIETNDPDFSHYLEHRIKYMDGGSGFISVRFYIVKDENGNTIKTYGVNQDITEKKIAEQQIIESKEKAEESDRLKSAFLANMSHEIRTPMNGILGFATLLKEPQLEEDELEQYIEVIERSGVRMLNIINDLIDISKIEAHQMEVKAEDTIINDQILFLKKFFLPEAEKNQIQLITHMPLANEQSQIFTDKEKFFAILSNLTKNALKFTQKGHIEIGYQVLDEHQIEFYVKDTGIGIPIDRQPNIFERFIQAETAHNREYEGAGLGLAISKAYAEMLGGKIWIEYSNEKGTKFKFTVLKNLGKKVKK